MKAFHGHNEHLYKVAFAETRSRSNSAPSACPGNRDPGTPARILGTIYTLLLHLLGNVIHREILLSKLQFLIVLTERCKGRLEIIVPIAVAGVLRPSRTSPCCKSIWPQGGLDQIWRPSLGRCKCKRAGSWAWEHRIAFHSERLRYLRYIHIQPELLVAGCRLQPISPKEPAGPLCCKTDLTFELTVRVSPQYSPTPKHQIPTVSGRPGEQTNPGDYQYLRASRGGGVSVGGW
jgi:hypothetical protein